MSEYLGCNFDVAMEGWQKVKKVKANLLCIGTNKQTVQTIYCHQEFFCEVLNYSRISLKDTHIKHCKGQSHKS